MSRAVVTLTTDFGTADGYVGAMKGRMLTIAPEAVLVDITHQLTPQDVLRGAWCLRRAGARFPAGTVHLAVVDPGVGSERAGLVVETTRYTLVGPDNGLLSLLAADDGVRTIRRIADTGRDWHKSLTFDGLTLFAPLAAHLAAGMAKEEAGEAVEEMVTLSQPSARHEGNEVEGEILFFDRFGNAITNITREELGGARVASVRFGAWHAARMTAHYSQQHADAHEPGALFNSDGLLELVVFGRSLREQLDLRGGEPVTVTLAAED